MPVAEPKEYGCSAFMFIQATGNYVAAASDLGWPPLAKVPATLVIIDEQGRRLIFRRDGFDGTHLAIEGWWYKLSDVSVIRYPELAARRVLVMNA